MKNKKKFQEFMALLGEIHEKKMTPTFLKAYWTILESYSDEQCEMAFKQVIAHSRFFPKPADLLEYIMGTETQKAISSWQETMKVLETRYPGEDTKVNWIVDHTVKAIGGWDYLSSLSFDELKWVEKRFLEHYPVIEKKRHEQLLGNTFKAEQLIEGKIKEMD